MGFLVHPAPGETNGNGTIPEDINGDSEINITDLPAVMGAWGSCEGCAEDINEDGFANVADLLALLAVW